jgi:hypothetical protein
MGKTALRLTLVSAFAFCLAIGMGIIPALAQTAEPGAAAGSSQVANTGEHEVEFAGTIQSIDGITWTVSGKVFVVDANTKIKPNPAAAVVGAFVKVEAVKRDDGSLLAKEIEVGKPERHVEFKGIISAFSATEWTVGGKTVVISPTTKIKGTPAIGLLAEVHAILDGATLRAVSIEVHKAKVKKITFTGRITSMNGNTWVVSGKTVILDANTKISKSKIPAAVGARVVVTGYRQPDGSILATGIRVTRAH